MSAPKARMITDLNFEPAGGSLVELQTRDIQGDNGIDVEVSLWLDGTYAVCAVAALTGKAISTTDFGPPQYNLNEMQANLAIQEILDLDERGKRKDYLDERPER